ILCLTLLFFLQAGDGIRARNVTGVQTCALPILFALLSPVIVVLAALFIPLLDLVLAVVRRVAAGKSPFAPDKKHLHHRLLRLGHTQKQVVLVLYTWVGVAAFSAVGSTVLPTNLTAILVGVLLLVAVVSTAIPLWQSGKVEDRVIRRE